MTLQKSIRFTTDAGGLEKLLRLLQALSQILAASATTPEAAKRWIDLRTHFALGRRYFRFFRFLGSFAEAWACFTTATGAAMLLGVGRWGFLGGYLGLESVTILDAMGVWPTPWAKMCLIEANKLWFYSLVCSILGSFLQLLGGASGTARVKRPAAGGREKAAAEASAEARAKGAKNPKKSSGGVWVRRLAIDCLDLLVPGSVVGWIPASPVVVGVATAIGTILSSKDIWDKM